MNCPNCGGVVEDGSRFCGKCGIRLRRPGPDEKPALAPTQTQAPIRPMQGVYTPEEQLKNARVGYQAAVSLWNVQAQLSWSRFNVILLSNSIILGAICVVIFWRCGLLLWPLLTQLLSLVGIVLSLVWLHGYRRASQYNDYLALSARELEKYLAEPVVTISRGALFLEGNQVTLTIDDKKKKLRLGLLPRLAETESFSYLMIAVFLLLFVFVFLFLFLRVA
jgi:hypothetical protein